MVTLRGKEKVFRSREPAGFPPMDQLYAPKVQVPTHYRDYSRTMIPGAREKWLEILGADSDPQEHFPLSPSSPVAPKTSPEAPTVRTTLIPWSGPTTHRQKH